MTAMEAEIASQPSCWRESVALAQRAAALPADGERVVAVGCGTSFYVARAYASLREASGAGPTDAFPASELPPSRHYDRVLALSRSGTTTEVVRLLETRERATPATVITADPDTPAGALATPIVLDFADERSVVQTRFATSALVLLRAHLGHTLDPAIGDAERVLEAPIPVDPERVDHIAFLGHGWTVGIAEEAALKLKEASRTYSEAYPAMEYRHGPLSLAGDRSIVWIVGSPDPTLADDVRATGATTRVADLDPLAELVLAQRTAVAFAHARGLDPDHPRHLSRSVVLT